MNRRKFLIGAGSLAAGSAAAMGTGAFGSVEANRDVSVNVAGDSNAYVGLSVPSGADFAQSTGGTVEFNFDENHNGGGSGNGLNADADTYMGPELTVTNQGQDAFLLLLDPSDINNKLDTGSLSFYIHTASENGIAGDLGGTVAGAPPNTGKQGVILTVGASVTIGGAFRDITENPANVNFEDADLTVWAVTDESERYPNSGPSDQRPQASSPKYPIVLDPDDSDGGSEYGQSQFS